MARLPLSGINFTRNNGVDRKELESVWYSTYTMCDGARIGIIMPHPSYSTWPDTPSVILMVSTSHRSKKYNTPGSVSQKSSRMPVPSGTRSSHLHRTGSSTKLDGWYSTPFSSVAL